MAVPLRNDQEQLTTADLAKGPNRAEQPTTESPGPKPVASARNVNERTGTPAEESTPLFPGNELDGLRGRWKEIQTAFVDEPRMAVEQADGLVAQAMKRLAEVFAEERSQLEVQWDRGGDVSTEDLRIAFHRYRSFFDRLLSV